MAIPSTPGTDSPRNLDTSTTTYLANSPSHTDKPSRLIIIIRTCSSLGLPVSIDINQDPNWRKKEPARTPAGWRVKGKEMSQKRAEPPAENRWKMAKVGTESRASDFSAVWASILSLTTSTSTHSSTNCPPTSDRLVFTIIIVQLSSAFVPKSLYALYCAFQPQKSLSCKLYSLLLLMEVYFVSELRLL